MSDAFKSVVAYKLVIIQVILFSVNALALSYVNSLNNAEWSSMSPTVKSVTIMSIIGTWTNTLLAYFNRSYERVEQGKSFLPTGQTEIFTKDQTMK